MSYYLVPKNGGEKYKREGYFSIKSRLAIWLAEEVLYIGTLVLIMYRHPGIMDRLAGNIKWIVLATIAISLALASLSQYLVEEKLMRFAFSHGIKVSVWTFVLPNFVVIFLVFFIGAIARKLHPMRYKPAFGLWIPFKHRLEMNCRVLISFGSLNICRF